MKLTDGQLQLFDIILGRKYPRVHVMAHTRYGKSLTVALAVLLRVATWPEKWAIVAPSEKKARIIMGYIIDHIFDDSYMRKKFVLEKGESADRIRRERSKSRINFKHNDGTLGEVFILSADSRNKQKAGDALMGFGASNVILDEAALIDDDIEAKIFRMLGDSMDNFYCLIGNPFKRNHFLKAYRDPKYHKLNFDVAYGLREGRVTQEYLEEVQRKPFYDILYENKFPTADMVDDKGWSNLILDSELERACVELQEFVGEKRLGVDIARGGGNYNVWALRSMNQAKVLAKNRDDDLMSVVGTTIRLCKENQVEWGNVFLDDTGVGGGVTDRMREQGFHVSPVTLGAKAQEEDKYVNKRAQDYWRLKEWLNKGGKLSKEDDWVELLDMKYKADSRGAIQIMSKDEMRRNGIESPDVADALMLTFDRPWVLKVLTEDQLFQKKMREKLKKHNKQGLRMV